MTQGAGTHLQWPQALLEAKEDSMDWSIDTIPDLKDKIIVVTGANSGIGLEATKVFAARNAHVAGGLALLPRGVHGSREAADE